MIIDTQLEHASGWESHVGSDISGQPDPLVPDVYEFTQWSDCIKFYIKGKPYTQWLAALHRPLLPNTGYLALAFELMTDALAPSSAQAIEFDTRVSIAGYNYNFSAQINYANGGVLQTSDATGKWQDTSYKPGKLIAGIWYPVHCHYAFDQHLRMYQTEQIKIGSGVERYQPAATAMLPATLMPWADSCSLQIQQDLASAGGEYSIYIKNVQYEWK